MVYIYLQNLFRRGLFHCGSIYFTKEKQLIYPNNIFLFSFVASISDDNEEDVKKKRTWYTFSNEIPFEEVISITCVYFTKGKYSPNYHFFDSFSALLMSMMMTVKKMVSTAEKKKFHIAKKKTMSTRREAVMNHGVKTRIV